LPQAWSLSFVIVGLFVATIGYTIGLDADQLRAIAAALIIVVSAVLMLPRLQMQLAVASGPIASWTDRRFGNFSSNGLFGQFSVGVLLGAVWSPCVGPTLGAASLLAAQGRDLLRPCWRLDCYRARRCNAGAVSCCRQEGA
jgi:cytochrome c-type biogenesis protein